MAYEQELLDFTIGEIVNVVSIVTDRYWKLNNLTYPDQWVFSYMLSGETTYLLDGDTVRIGSGSMLFFPTNIYRSATGNDSNPGKFIAVKFRLDEKNEYSSKILRSIPNHLEQTSRSMVSDFQEIADVWSRKHPGYAIRCKGILYNMLYQLLDESEQMAERQQYKEKLREPIAQIENNYSRNFNVKELAEFVGLSESYFRYIFKQHTGYSPVQYQNYIKMTRARDLLLCEHYNVSEVAEMVGIDDENYFGRLFKKVIGVTPSKIISDGNY